MMLLSFTVRNHGSIRDELTLDLIRPTLKTLRPAAKDSWSDHVYPVAGIFGANATGKTAILEALAYAVSAIRHSSTSWQAERRIPRNPFALDDDSLVEPSEFELDFIHDGRRHVYGFALDDDGVVREWLRDIPSSRWRTLLDRRREEGHDVMKAHASLSLIGTFTSRELVLSRALVLSHPQLAPIALDLVQSFDLVSVKDTHRERRLESIADQLVEGRLTFDDIVTLLQVADIGVENVTVQEDNLPEFMRKFLRDFSTTVAEGGTGANEPGVREELDDEESDLVIRNLLFTHSGSGSAKPHFSIQDESDGTIAWLALMVPALEILRTGGLYCVDEIDSSLHPHLLDVLLGMFLDVELNPGAAQLVFTSHETYVLSPLSDIELEPEQVWFTEKSNDGATELVSLADFPKHRDANIAKRYLLGRYGGTPRLAPGALAALVSSTNVTP